MRILKLGQSLSTSKSVDSFMNLFSLNFDGVDDFVDLGNDSSLRPAVSGGISLSLWCKWADITTATSRMFSNSSNSSAYNGIACNKNTTGKLAMHTGDGGGMGGGDRRTLQTNSAVVSNNTWHHIVFVWTDETQTNWKIYVDGSAKAATASGTGSTNVYTTDDAFIGKRITGSTTFANGKMDEISFYNTALTSDRVLTIYNSGTPTDLTHEPDLIGYWRNGDPNGTSSFDTITDDSRNNNNGSMANMSADDIVTDAP